MLVSSVDIHVPELLQVFASLSDLLYICTLPGGYNGCDLGPVKPGTGPHLPRVHGDVGGEGLHSELRLQLHVHVHHRMVPLGLTQTQARGEHRLEEHTNDWIYTLLCIAIVVECLKHVLPNYF